MSFSLELRFSVDECGCYLVEFCAYLNGPRAILGNETTCDVRLRDLTVDYNGAFKGVTAVVFHARERVPSPMR